MVSSKRGDPLYSSPRWRALRLRIIARDRYRCVVCGIWVGGKGAARVDHIQRVADAPHRTFDPSNLRTLCTTCDAQAHTEKGYPSSTKRIEQFNYGFDDLGNPNDPKHNWNKPALRVVA